MLGELLLRADRVCLLVMIGHVGVLLHVDDHLVLKDDVGLVLLKLLLTEPLRRQLLGIGPVSQDIGDLSLLISVLLLDHGNRLPLLVRVLIEGRLLLLSHGLLFESDSLTLRASSGFGGCGALRLGRLDSLWLRLGRLALLLESALVLDSTGIDGQLPCLAAGYRSTGRRRLVVGPPERGGHQGLSSATTNLLHRYLLVRDGSCVILHCWSHLWFTSRGDRFVEMLRCVNFILAFVRLILVLAR